MSEIENYNHAEILEVANKFMDEMAGPTDAEKLNCLRQIVDQQERRIFGFQDTIRKLRTQIQEYQTLINSLCKRVAEFDPDDELYD
jgi:septal ring factor EnvC (AmiA/AmiB activator)